VQGHVRPIGKRGQKKIEGIVDKSNGLDLFWIKQ